MIFEMRKFGQTLNGRPAGKEAVLRVKQILNGGQNGDDIVLDFNGVEILTISFADEFVNGIKREYPNRKIEFQGIDSSPVMRDTLKEIGSL